MVDTAKKLKANISYRMADPKHKEQKQPYYDKLNQHPIVHQPQ